MQKLRRDYMYCVIIDIFISFSGNRRGFSNGEITRREFGYKQLD